MSSTSVGVLTCFAGYSIFYHIKVSQVMKQSALLQRAPQDDRNGHSTCYIWSFGEKYITSLVEYNLGSL
jgi:hypothetical protein